MTRTRAESMKPDQLFGADTFNRINIVGSSGGGKSTAEKLIVQNLGHPYVKFDEIQWKLSWAETTEEESGGSELGCH
jgi:ABC-type dipeptide/oligopeptide/nickel transport system ATPase component